VDEGLSGLTLCIINHNGEPYLRDTLAAATASHQPFDEVLLVDNDSTDGGLDIARECFPAVRILRLGRNRGPGPARNAGAREAGNDRILFIDNDVVLLPGCAELLCGALDARQEATFAMPAVLYAKRPGTVQYDGAGAHFVGLMIIENADLPVQQLSTEPREIDSLITACFLTDRGRWGEDPLFDEAFFFYFEDHELGLRARLRSHAILSVPAARCLHREGSIGVSLRQTGAYTAVRVRNTMLNRWRILLKLYELRTLLLLSPALVSFEVFQLTGALAKGWLRHWLWAAVELAWTLSKIGVGRRSFQRHRCLGDGDVLTGGPLPFNPALSTGRLGRLAQGLLGRVAELNWKLAHRFLRRSIAGNPA
jgi:GT2 family glycosyltransferase